MSIDNPVLFDPDDDPDQGQHMGDYMAFLGANGYGLYMSYAVLLDWSVNDPRAFWQSIWEYTGVIASTEPDEILDTTSMPGARWFTGARLNFAENLLREAVYGDGEKVAIVEVSEAHERLELTYGELLSQVGALEAYLVSIGVQANDRVAGIVANSHEAIVAMLACTSLGAIWASASPDFGVRGLVDRFAQIEPKVLISVDGYRYGGKDFDCRDRIAELCGHMPSIEAVILTDHTASGAALPEAVGAIRWRDALAKGAGARPSFTPGDFDQPVYILFSSGTTGIPKCIVHGAGGVLLQHSKELILHGDIGGDDVFFYFTTCGWMMWNWLASGLVTGATLVLYDGNPGYPDMDVLWQLAEDERITHFGASAPWLAACRKAGIRPGENHNLSILRVIFSTGSPLLPAEFDWVYEHVKAEVLLGSISGGTDIVSSFVGCCTLLPVRRGEIQCCLLGVAAAAFNDAGESVIEECGELVCTQPLPSMPVGFWNDPDGAAYRAAYFETFDGVWAHGDYVLFTQEGGAIIYGRSDATLNIGGVRIGTAEIYRQIEAFPEIADAIVVAQPHNEAERSVLLVVMAPGQTFDDALADRIREQLRTQASPRHVPNLIAAVPAVPYTRSGKKVELAVAKLLRGQRIDNTEALANPESLDGIAAMTVLDIPKTNS